MNHFKKFLSITLAITLLVIGVSFLYNSAESSIIDHNIEGYAWGADTVITDVGGLGWLSFHNCVGEGNCSGPDYGVFLDDTTGDLSGYAWSSNFGWLQFGGLSGFPGGAGSNASVDMDSNSPTYGEVSGWARFVTGAGGVETGDWDGWVSLNGSNYGVDLNLPGNAFSGYAWGGGDDSYGNANTTGVGWIDFSGVTYEPFTGEPGITLVAVPSQALPANGYLVELQWHFTPPDLPVGTLTNCQATTDGSGTGWGGGVNPPGPPGSPEVQSNVYVPDNPTTFWIACDDTLNGGTVVGEVSVPRPSQTDEVRLNHGSVIPESPGVSQTILSWFGENLRQGTCVGTDNANEIAEQLFGPGSTFTTNWGGDTGELVGGNGNYPGGETVLVLETGNSTICTTYTVTCVSLLTGEDVPDSECINEDSPASNIRPEFREE